MEQAAARQRVEPLEGGDLLARGEPADRGEVELVRADGEPLERGDGVGARRGPRAEQDVARALGDLDDAVVRREARPPARPARAQRAREPVVQLEEIARAPSRLRRPGTEERAQARQIVLDLVDGARGIAGRRPRQPRLSDLGRVALEGLRVGDAAGQRAPDLHRVERRHARPRLGQLDPRVGEVHAPGRRADGQAEEQPLVLRAIALRREPAAQLAPERVEQDRVLPRLLGEDALGEAGDEHHVERAPPRLLERAHEHPPVAHRRRPLGDRRQLVGEHVAHLVERHRPDRAERAQLREHGEDPLRPPQHHRGDPLQLRDPLAPGGAGG